MTPREPERSKTLNRSAPLNRNDLETPKNRRQVKELTESVLVMDSELVTMTQRRGLWKLQKAFNDLTAKNVAHEQEIEQLKAALKRKRPLKRR